MLPSQFYLYVNVKFQRGKFAIKTLTITNHFGSNAVKALVICIKLHLNQMQLWL